LTRRKRRGRRWPEEDDEPVIDGDDVELCGDHVHVYELCLVAGWYRDAISGQGAHPPAHEIDRMRSLLRRLR
jgi:hypothetical protein